LQTSFDKCWADARAHAAARDNKYDTRWKEMLVNQGVRIALLKATSAAKKRNTYIAFLIGGNDAVMNEETRAWYDVHRQDILLPPSIALSSTSTPAAATPAADDASPPEAQEGTADEPVIIWFLF
jgi:predicted phage-related endonuclease